MLYDDVTDLPHHIKSVLPDPLLELYKDSYNSAFNEYENDVLAHKAAWGLIENKYPRENRRKR